MKKIKDTIIIIFLSCVVGGVISGAVYLTSNIYKESQANRIIIQERIYEEGKKAGMLRLHPSLNPYKYQSDSQIWSYGYVAGVELSVQKPESKEP